MHRIVIVKSFVVRSKRRRNTKAANGVPGNGPNPPRHPFFALSAATRCSPWGLGLS